MIRPRFAYPASLLVVALALFSLPGCKSQQKKDAEACVEGGSSFGRLDRCLPVCAKAPDDADSSAACLALKGDIGSLCYGPWSEAHPATPAYLGGKPDFRRWTPAQPQCAKFCDQVDKLDREGKVPTGSALGDVKRDCDQTRKASW